MSEPIKRPIVEAPFTQERYIRLLKERLHSLMLSSSTTVMSEAKINEMIAMCDVLISDNCTTMMQELPEKYYGIIGHSGQVGTTTDPDDMWFEEPDYEVVEITKEEYDAANE